MTGFITQHNNNGKGEWIFFILDLDEKDKNESDTED